ncbi:hypothetical protein BDZ45DRAFT_753184 [Acephala macrosclerotiorum]|nr:hypothetical protein BDZ45DRAFT_753184 [Acephala macrosclerotiorum]
MGSGFQHMGVSRMGGQPIHEKYDAIDANYQRSFRNRSHIQDDIDNPSDDAAKSVPNSLWNLSSSTPTHSFRHPIRQYTDRNTGGHISQVFDYGANTAMNGGLAAALPLPGSPQDLPLETDIRTTSQVLEETSTFAEFRYFQDLPFELRLVVWNMALERTVHLRISERANSFQYDIHTDNNDHQEVRLSCKEAYDAITNKYKRLSNHRQCQAHPTCFGSGFEVLQIDGKLKSAWQLTNIIGQLPNKNVFESISISHIEMWVDVAGYTKLASPPLVLLFKNLKTVYITVPKVPWKKGCCALHNGPCNKVVRGGLCFPIDRSGGGPSFLSSVRNMKEKVQQFLDDFNIENKTNIIFALSFMDEQTRTSFSKPLPVEPQLPFLQSTERKAWAATKAKKKARKAAVEAEKAKEDQAKVAKEMEPLTRNAPLALNSWSTFNLSMAYDTSALASTTSTTASSTTASNNLLATNTRPAYNTPLGFKTGQDSDTDEYYDYLGGDFREDSDYFGVDLGLCDLFLGHLEVNHGSSATLEDTQNN